MDYFRKVNQSEYTETMPEYPARVLGIHLFHKGMQAGSLLGLAAVLPVAYFRKQSLLSVWKKLVPVVTAFTTGVTLAAPHFMRLDNAGVDDRAYRLAKSVGQNKVDFYGTIGMSAGAVLGGLSGVGIFPAIATGAALGTVVYVAEAEFQKMQNGNNK